MKQSTSDTNRRTILTALGAMGGLSAVGTTAAVDRTTHETRTDANDYLFLVVTTDPEALQEASAHVSYVDDVVGHVESVAIETVWKTAALIE